MQHDELRDTLAIEITREIFSAWCAKPEKDTLKELLEDVYNFVDAVLSKRNVSKPVITHHD